MQLATAMELVLVLVVMPTALGAVGLMWAAPFLDRFHQGQLKDRGSLRNWIRNGVPAVLIFLQVGGTLTLTGLVITFARPDLGLGPAVALSVATILLIPAAVPRYRLMYRMAYESWARGTGLTRADVIVGVQEVVRYRRWEWIAITCIFNGAQTGVICLLLQGPDLDQIQLAGLPVAAACIMTWLGVRLATLAHPTAEFLEKLASAIRANRNQKDSRDDDFLDLNKHRDRRLGSGVAFLLDSLPALHRSLNVILRRHPELPEKEIREDLASLFAKLRQTASADGAVAPSESITLAVRMALLGELPVMERARGIRPLNDDPGWSREQAVLPGDVGRWLPSTARQVGKVVAAVVTVVAAVVTIVMAILR